MGVIIAALPAHSWGAGSFGSEQNHSAKPNCMLSVYHFDDSGPDRNAAFHFSKVLIDRLEMSGLLVDNCDVFISYLDSHPDGTHSLQRIHWWASDARIAQ